jgi:predicted PolB exonuclease-like 3'-5' exonuclease
MQDNVVIVWDVETVPDIDVARRMLDMKRASEDEVRAALGPGFPKHPLHKIACIGALVATQQPDGWRIDALGAPHIGERPESDLIRSFADKIGGLKPQLITFNGHSFDLPVLRYRAMVNRVCAPGLQARPYFHRYAEDALDLCDVFGSYTPGAKIKLDEICKIIGLPGKPRGIDGSEIEAMVLGGRIAAVAQYWESDVLNTYRLWVVYELFRGTVTAEQLAYSETQATDFVRTRKSDNPHLLASFGATSGKGDDAQSPLRAVLQWFTAPSFRETGNPRVESSCMRHSRRRCSHMDHRKYCPQNWN